MPKKSLTISGEDIVDSGSQIFESRHIAVKTTPKMSAEEESSNQESLKKPESPSGPVVEELKTNVASTNIATSPVASKEISSLFIETSSSSDSSSDSIGGSPSMLPQTEIKQIRRSPKKKSPKKKSPQKKSSQKKTVKEMMSFLQKLNEKSAEKLNVSSTQNKSPKTLSDITTKVPSDSPLASPSIASILTTSPIQSSSDNVSAVFNFLFCLYLISFSSDKLLG